MKILFIQQTPFINIGIITTSAYLKSKNYETDLIIDNVEKNTIKKILKINPDIIAFSCTTGLHTWVLNIAKKIKREKNIPILVGGSHPTFYPEYINNKPIDIICIGEGEEPILELLEMMKKGKSIKNIKNLHVKIGNKIYENDVRNLIDLDKLPYPDIDLYKRYKFIMKQKNYRTITGRGCPYNCSFCFNKSLKKIYKNKGQYLRKKSVKNMIMELEYAKSNYNFKKIDFQDDIFIYNTKWLKLFLKEYKEKINIPFTCNVRANLVNKKIAKLLSNSGCHSVKMGIESGNEYLNNHILKKNLTKNQIINAVNNLKRVGIKIETFSIIGIPGETIENAIETLKFNIELKTDFARCSLLQPYPRTEIWEYTKKNNLLDSTINFKNSYFIDTPIKLANKTEIINIQRLFNIIVKFPFLFKFIKKLIKVPNNFVYDILFKIDYALSILVIDKISLYDFFIFGFYSKNYFE